MGIQAIGSCAAANVNTAAGSSPARAMPAAGKPAPAARPAEGGEKAASSSDSSKIYDKKDADKDGVVSYQEELLYSIQHPENDPAVSSSKLQQGLKAYQQTQQSFAGQVESL